MTFQTGVWAVDGNQVAANLARLMAQAANNGGQGVIGHLDCRVQANSPATAGVIITSGGVTINGIEVTNQGNYTAWNVGNDTSLTIAATAGTARSDMIIARAEDPTFSGSPWGGPASGQIVFPRVWSNCGAGATQPPNSWSAIPLARIDMPASTSVVQSSYITDLRQVAVPLRVLDLVTVAGPATAHAWTTSTVQVNWPTNASWQIPIPSWATRMVITWGINDALWNNVGNGWARGWIWLAMGTNVLSPVTISSPLVLVSIPAATGPYRHAIGGAGSMAIPASVRGTTQTFQFAQYADGTNTGTLSVDEGSNTWMLYQFQQQAAAA